MNDHQDALHEEDDLPAGPSKSERKRQMHAIQDIGEELAALGKDRLKQLDLPEALREALAEYQRIRAFGAQRRQLQYIGKLMRSVDTAPIIAKLEAWKGVSHAHTAHLHLLERWRERLLDDEGTLTELLGKYPDIDAQRLRTLIRNAKKETAAQKPPKSFREIYQLLKEAIPE